MDGKSRTQVGETRLAFVLWSCSMPSKHPELRSEMGSASSPCWPGLAPELYIIQFQRPFLSSDLGEL